MGFDDWPFVGSRGKRLRRLLAQVAEPALEKIRCDRDRPQPTYPVREAFEVLEERLFSRELQVKHLFQATLIKGATAFESFQRITGLTPAKYIEERRLETAVGLILLDKALTIEVLAAAIGYDSADSFRRAFRRWGGLAPGHFRQSLWKHKAAGASGPESSWFASGWLARFEAGAVEPAERSAVVEWLATVYGPGRSESAESRARSAFERYERSWAQTWWQLSRGLAVRELRPEVAAAPFATPALCEHLCERSPEEGRDDRRRGVEIAELALAALEPLAERLPSATLGHWRVKAWGCLGNARCLALDFAGAEEALATAEGWLGKSPGAARQAELRAELLFYRSCLRFFERRPGQALSLADDALKLLEGFSGRLIAQLLLARAQINAQLGQAELALPDLQRAIEELDAEGEPYLAVVARQNLATALWRAHRPAEAVDWLRGARPLAARLGHLGPWCHTLWLEGLLAEETGGRTVAATRLREACEGLRGLGKWGHFAVAALDLARVEMKCGEAAEAARWAAQALPYLGKLQLEREGLAALELLRRTLATEQLNATLLVRARRYAGWAAGAPALQGEPQP